MTKCRVYPHIHAPLVTYIDTESAFIQAFGQNFIPVDNRPDIKEHSCGLSQNFEGKTHFVLKADGEVLTKRAAEALSWAQKRFKCTSNQSIVRNCTFLRFKREHDAVLFKMFWL